MPTIGTSGSACFAGAGGINLATDADERIFGRLIAVAWREDRRPLHVRIVVGAAAGDVDRRDAAGREHSHQLDRLGEIDFQRIVCCDAEATVVGQHAVVIHRLAELPAAGVGDRIEHAEPDADQRVAAVRS